MDKPLEAELREVLASRAADVPADAVERLIQADYRPRIRRVTPRAAIGALSGASVVGTGVVAAVLLTGATPAYAGWTAAPAHSGTRPPAAADSSCEARLATLPTAPRGSWTLVVTDVRGPYTLAVYENAGIDGTCLTGPSVTAVSVYGAGGGSQSVSSSGSNRRGVGVSSSDGFVGDGGIERVSQDHLSSAAGPYTVIEGSVASDVSAVSLELSDGTDVRATVGGGWFLAWWPSSVAATAAQVTTPSGVTTQPLSREPAVAASPGRGRSGEAEPVAEIGDGRAGVVRSADDAGRY